MVAIVIESDCLAPERQIIIHYKGPDPFKAYLRLRRAMRDIWEVEAKDYWERDFRYDETDGKFFVKAYVNKGLDRFTEIYPEIVMQGVHPLKPNEDGTVEIRISGTLKTTIGGRSILTDMKNPFFRLMALTYVRYFYRDQIRFYLREWCYNRLQRLKRFYQELLNIAPS